MPGTWAVIVAAGRGSRFGAETPKQYLPLKGRCVLYHTLCAFLDHPRISGVLVVIHPDDGETLRTACPELIDRLQVAHGGATRQESVRLGLEALWDQEPHSVLIHDAARPLVDSTVIDRLIDRVRCGNCAIAAAPVVDSLKFATGDVVERKIEREGLWQAQTPQAFPYDIILAAHRALAEQNDFTDDAAVVEAKGHPVYLVESSRDNIKITTPADLALAERLISAETTGGSTTEESMSQTQMETRTGSGYDVHSFEEGDHVILCGLSIPHDKKLKGHSDADVGLHALTDALFGALCDGDIGSHFPPSDPQWKGAASDQFLVYARDKVLARGGRITHVDITLICERPKIGPHRDAMRERVAEILEISPARVSVKATTSEKLGFTGREEGIAAQAMATIQIPEEDL